jgi:hypothetical protein
MPQSQRVSSAIPFVAIQRPACPKCKAAMMLASIELARPGVDLHTFECAICNHVLNTLAAYADPMKSRVSDVGFRAICTHRHKAPRGMLSAKQGEKPMPSGLFRSDGGWVQVDYGTGTTIPVPRSKYEANGYKPDFDKLPSEAEYWAAEEKKEDDAQALKSSGARPT